MSFDQKLFGLNYTCINARNICQHANVAFLGSLLAARTESFDLELKGAYYAE